MVLFFIVNLTAEMRQEKQTYNDKKVYAAYIEHAIKAVLGVGNISFNPFVYKSEEYFTLSRVCT